MSRESREVINRLKHGEARSGEAGSGMLRAVKEGIQAVAPGLSLGKMWEDIKAEAKNQLAHGSHEIASALFSGTGSAFVMYPRASREAQKQEAQDKARDGREMQHER